MNGTQRPQLMAQPLTSDFDHHEDQLHSRDDRSSVEVPSHVAVVGVGAMGMGLAQRLASQDVAVQVYDHDPMAKEAAVRRGLLAVDDLAALGSWADTAICMLPHPDVFREILRGPGGLVSHMRPGTLIVDMATDGPEVILEGAALAREKGIDLVDAPVGRGPEAAAGGRLIIMVGGTEEQYERVKPLLLLLGEQVFHCGPLGCGQIAKVINNLVSVSSVALAAEAYVLARRSEVDLDALTAIMTRTGADGAMLRKVFVDRLPKRDFSPEFKVSLSWKDLKLALQLAESLEASELLRCGKGALVWYEDAIAIGCGDLDMSAILMVGDSELRHAVSAAPTESVKEKAPGVP